SKGPEPSPTPPPPTPTPQPAPTPPPPPPPTAQPTANAFPVHDYTCKLLGLARVEIQNDGFVAEVQGTGPTDDAAWVIWQQPQSGTTAPNGATIQLWTVAQPAPTTCPQEPA